MKPISIVSLVLIAILSVVSIADAAVASTVSGDDEKIPIDVQILLAKLRAVTAKHLIIFGDETDGYEKASDCVPQMGYHFVNFELFSDQSVDALRPEGLVYEQKNGLFKLVAAEYLMIALANTPEGPEPWFGPEPPPDGFFTAKPSLFGRPFDGPMAGHEEGMPWHYDLHAYIWKSNPDGIFTAFNPRVSC